MAIVNIFKTEFNKMFAWDKLTADMASFVVQHHKNILVPDTVVKKIFNQSSILKTLFHQFLDMILKLTYKSSKPLFTFITLDSVLDKHPELMDSFLKTHMIIDIKQIKDINEHAYKAFITIPEFKDTIIINLTNNISSKGDIRDITLVNTQIVLGALVRNYYSTSSFWLNPLLEVKLAENYGTVIGYNIARLYNLTFQEQQLISGILAIYYLQKCVVQEGTIPNTAMSCKKFGGPMMMSSLVNSFKQKFGNKEFNLEDIVEAIREFGPERIKTFNLGTFIHSCRTYNSIPPFSIMSVEYPPYWFFNILTAISGMNKSNMYWTLKKTNMLKESKELCESALMPSFYENIFR